MFYPVFEVRNNEYAVLPEVAFNNYAAAHMYGDSRNIGIDRSKALILNMECAGKMLS
jgi:hypothetical protein